MIKTNEKGFSVVELLITLIIIGTTFGAFTTAFVSIQSITKKGSDVITANQLAFAKVQEYENKTFASLPATSPVNTLTQVEDFSSTVPTVLESPRVAKVYVSTNSTGNLKQVIVRVEFGSGDGKRIVEYGNFIQRNGLGR